MRGKGHDDSLKTVKCNTCDNKLQVEKHATGGNCWECVTSGRAFMLPEALAKAPSNQVLLYSDDYAHRVEAAGGVRILKGEKRPKAPKPERTPSKSRLGQTKLIDELLAQGMSEEDIAKEVEKRIPEYPKDKIPKLIKLRIYHGRKKEGK